MSDQIKSVMDNPARLSRLFHGLSDQEFEKLLQQAELLNLKIGSSLFHGNEKIDHTYILLSGKIRLTVKAGEREATLLSLNKSGEIFGSVTEGFIPDYGARSSADSQVMRIPSADFRSMKESNQEFSNVIERELRLINWQRTLQGLSISEIISPNNLRILLNHASQNIVEKGAKALDAWCTKDSLAIILSGSFVGSDDEKLSIGDHLNTTSSSSVKSPGTAESPKTASVRLPSAQERSHLLILDSANLSQLFDEFPALESEVLSYKASVGNRVETYRRNTRIGRIEGLKQSAPEATKELNEETQPLIRLQRELRKKFGFYPILYQQNAMDCGSTCIAMVALHYGQRLDLNRVRSMANVSAAGTSMYALAQAAEDLGFMCRGIAATYEGLMHTSLPVICYWRNEHFVVLFQANEKEAIIGDPAEGLLRLTPEEFNKSFSGLVLELTPTQKLGSAAKATPMLRRLVSFVVPYKWEALHVFIATLIYQTLMLIIPLFTQAIVDKVVVHQSLPLLNTMALGMLIFACFETVVTFIRGYIQSYLAIRLDQSLIIQFFRHLVSLPFKFFEDRTIGDIITRFGENQKIRDFLSGSSITILLDVLVLVIYLIVIFVYNVSFGFAVVGYLTAFTILVSIYTPILKHYGRMVFNRTSESQSFVIEAIRSIQLVKGAAAEQRIRWKWELLLSEQLESRFKELLANNTVQSLSRMLALAGQILLLYMGAQLVVKGELSIGQLVALNMMFGMIAQPVARIVEMWSGFQDVNVAMERLCDVLDHDPEELPGANRLKLDTVRGHIKFEDVTFRYNADAKENALDNINFEVLPGQLAAFVGRSGCGKTTILKLIQGLYNPNTGKVKVDDVDLAHMALTSYRQRTGVVSQNEYLFRGTVRENLTFNKPDASMQEIVEATTIAGVHRVIMNMQLGYDTKLSEGGFNVSGGERQRLAIARAILHKPSILLFDEATSALDTESERHIQESMEEIRKNHTMVVLAHRLSTIKEADIIFVVDHGRIVESGKYDDLVAARGLFYHLCKQQLST